MTTFQDQIRSLNEFHPNNWITFRVHNISYGREPGTVRLVGGDAYAIINEKDVEQGFIMPIDKSMDDNPLNFNFEVALKKGIDIEFHYKSISHDFKLDESARPFYIDVEQEELIFLPQMVEPTPYKCRYFIYLFYSKCCARDKTNERYGYAGCANEAADRKRCCPEMNVEDSVEVIGENIGCGEL